MLLRSCAERTDEWRSRFDRVDPCED